LLNILSNSSKHWRAHRNDTMALRGPWAGSSRVTIRKTQTLSLFTVIVRMICRTRKQSNLNIPLLRELWSLRTDYILSFMFNCVFLHCNIIHYYVSDSILIVKFIKTET
jgi:hypothetical protein